MNIIDRLLQHNRWATRVLLDRCLTLSPQQFQQRFEIGPGSLHDALLHVIGAMKRWADRIADRPVRPSIEKDPTARTPDQMLALLDEAHDELEAVMCRVARENRHAEIMSVEFQRHGEPIRFTRGTAIVHVLTHGAHHRAQCLNMLRRLGVEDLPDLDAIEWELQSTSSD